MAGTYTFQEYADMHLIYREVHGNSLAAQRVCQGRFPNRRVPHKSVFVAVDRRFLETGQVRLNTALQQKEEDRLMIMLLTVMKQF
jgi:hypothetical protein